MTFAEKREIVLDRILTPLIRQKERIKQLTRETSYWEDHDMDDLKYWLKIKENGNVIR